MSLTCHSLTCYLAVWAEMALLYHAAEPHEGYSLIKASATTVMCAHRATTMVYAHHAALSVTAGMGRGQTSAGGLPSTEPSSWRALNIDAMLQAYTTNIDGHCARVFGEGQVVEEHGTLQFLQVEPLLP